MILIVWALSMAGGSHAEGPASPTRGLRLVQAGKSAYVIVVGADASPAERFAAEELVSHLEEMSGAKLPIVTDAGELPARAILLGQSRYVKDNLLGVVVDWKQLGKEGCLLRTAGDRLIIAGGYPRGTLYGVYALLEDYLGCRWFAPDTRVIPKRETVSVPPLDTTEQPAFEYRDPVLWSGDGWSLWWTEHFDPDYVARMRHNGRWVDIHYRHQAIKESDSRIDERHGGHFRTPHYGHNLSSLVPAKDYAVSNPEYFALKDGKRVTEGDLELCLTNPDVARVAAETMRGWMRAEPEADMFFIGQSDSPNACRCDRCMAAMQTYEPGISPQDPGFGGRGGRAGLNLLFVNRVAELVEEEFPNVRIGTFAYQPTRRPPANIKAHRNVVIWYCTIEGCACHPLDKGPINKGFYDFEGDIQRWRQIAAGGMYLYAYDWSYNNRGESPSVLPIAPTVRAVYRLGARGAFVGMIADIQSGFGFLRYWLWMESLRKPDWDWEKGLGEFCRAYYGAAAPHIEGYLRLAGNPASYEPMPEDRANIWTSAESPNRRELVYGCHIGQRRLTDKSIQEGYALFQEALKGTENDPTARQHVEAARMELQYVMLDHLPAADPRLKEEAVSLLHLAKDLGMPMVQSKPLSEYRDQLSKRIGVTIPE